MIIFTRKIGQSIYFTIGGEKVVLKVLDRKGSIIRLGLLASMDVKIDNSVKEDSLREEPKDERVADNNHE